MSAGVIAQTTTYDFVSTYGSNSPSYNDWGTYRGQVVVDSSTGAYQSFNYLTLDGIALNGVSFASGNFVTTPGYLATSGPPYTTGNYTLNFSYTDDVHRYGTIYVYQYTGDDVVFLTSSANQAQGFGTVNVTLVGAAPEIDGSLAPKITFLLGCLFLMFGRKKQSIQSIA